MFLDQKDKLEDLKKRRNDQSVQIRILRQDREKISEEIAELEKTINKQDESIGNNVQSKKSHLESLKQQTENELKETEVLKNWASVVFKRHKKSGKISAEAIQQFCPGAQGKGVSNQDQLANRYQELVVFYRTKIQNLQQTLTNIEAGLKTATQKLDQFDKKHPQFKKLKQLRDDLYRVDTEIATMSYVAKDLWKFAVTAVFLNCYIDFEKEYSFLVEVVGKPLVDKKRRDEAAKAVEISGEKKEEKTSGVGNKPNQAKPPNQALRQLKNDLIQSKSEAETEYLFYQARISVVHKLLQQECQPADLNVFKREVVEGMGNARLDTEHIVKEQMVRMLDDCRAKNSLAQRSAPATTTRSQTPSECDLAVNLTEAWRQDHNESKMWPHGFSACL
ncbi:myosin-2 heavy chain-like [Watersipora subatra]|uniref:myosin-2 heavy chain-like n=1 Tax=Watersipora subatra TaxID=2589382 RepID=UPI00355B2302